MIGTFETHHLHILRDRRFWQMEEEWTKMQDEDTTAMLRRILTAREERFYEKPSWEKPSWPAARKRLPLQWHLQPETVSKGEAIYMATTLQRANEDTRMGLGDWKKLGAELEPLVELMRALWLTSTRQTGPLLLIAQREEVKAYLWLLQWADYLEERATADAWNAAAEGRRRQGSSSAQAEVDHLLHRAIQSLREGPVSPGEIERAKWEATSTQETRTISVNDTLRRLRPVMLALKRGVDLADPSLTWKNWIKGCAGLWRGTLRLPDVTPIYERTLTPISLDFAPPSYQTSYVLVRDLRELQNEEEREEEGGNGEAPAPLPWHRPTSLQPPTSRMRAQQEDMTRPTQPNCTRCNVGGAGIICDKWGHPTAWEPLCFACGAIPPRGFPTYAMNHRSTWWLDKGPRRGTSTNPSSSEEGDQSPRHEAQIDPRQDASQTDLTEPASPRGQTDEDNDGDLSDASPTSWRWESWTA